MIATKAMKAESKTILIVEDNKDFLWILQQSFLEEGLPTVCAADGEEGLAMAEKKHPDLIIADIMLPKLDGISMAKQVRQKGISSKIIFLTGFKDVEHISQAMEAAGDADYIVKTDLRVDEIVNRVKNKLGITSEPGVVR